MLMAILRFGKTVLSAVLMVLPSRFRKRIHEVVYEGLSRWFAPVQKIEGPLSLDGSLLRCLYVGEENLMGYLLHRSFAQEVRVYSKEKFSAPQLRRYVASSPDADDLVIMRLPKKWKHRVQGLYQFCGPGSVRQVNTSSSWEEIRSRFHANAKDAERKIRKYGFTCRTSRNRREFEIFYHQMFVPYIQKRFGGLAVVESFSELKRRFDEGFLLLLEKEARTVAKA